MSPGSRRAAKPAAAAAGAVNASFDRYSVLSEPSRRGKFLEAWFKGSLIACIVAALAVLAWLLVKILRDGLSGLSIEFLMDMPSAFAARAGIQSAIMGTLWLAVICTVFVVPTGVAAAIYLEEYADRNRWYNRLIEVNIQNLAAVPSIVYGILGLAYLVRGAFGFGPTILAGGLTLGLLVLPVVVIASREAIRAVPPSIREGAMGLGATKWQAVWHQVLPSAVPGIATGSILALSRAIGETAPLIMVGAAVYVPFNPDGLDSRFTALPMQIFNWLSNAQDDFKALAASAIIVLMVILLVFNSAAIIIRNRFERKW